MLRCDLAGRDALESSVGQAVLLLSPDARGGRAVRR
jgi:hypothetical protein